MFFSGIDSIDFRQALGGLGDILSPQQTVDVAWAQLPSWAANPFNGISKAKFSALILDALKSGGYGLSTSSANAIDNSVIVNAYKAKPDSTDTEATALSTTLSNLNGAGYYVVSTASKATTAPMPAQSYTSPTSAVTSWWNPVYAAASAATSAATGTPQSTPMQSGSSAVQQKRSDNPIIYRSQLKRLSAVEKNRLLWILGVGGALFVVALGIVASRD